MSDYRDPDHNPEGCPGCRPVVFDPRTGKHDERLTRIADAAFDTVTPAARRAWHRVTCLNSQDPIDINLSRQILEALHRAAAH